MHKSDSTFHTVLFWCPCTRSACISTHQYVGIPHCAIQNVSAVCVILLRSSLSAENGFAGLLRAPGEESCIYPRQWRSCPDVTASAIESLTVSSLCCMRRTTEGLCVCVYVCSVSSLNCHRVLKGSYCQNITQNTQVKATVLVWEGAGFLSLWISEMIFNRDQSQLPHLFYPRSAHS